MANYGIVQPLSVSAHNVDSQNIGFKNNGTNIENGSIFSRGGLASTTEQIFYAVQPATATLNAPLYMAVSPIRIITELPDGSQFVDLSVNPKAFTNVAGQIIDGIALNINDKIRLSEDAINGNGPAAYIVATTGDYKLNWADSVISGLTLQYIGASYISVADNFGSQRVTSYDFIVIATQ